MGAQPHRIAAVQRPCIRGVRGAWRQRAVPRLDLFLQRLEPAANGNIQLEPSRQGQWNMALRRGAGGRYREWCTADVLRGWQLLRHRRRQSESDAALYQHPKLQ